MRKNLFMSLLAFSLAGCGMHTNDPSPPQLKSSVTIVNNSVCIKVQPEGDEQIATISIGEVGNDKNSSYKHNLGMPVSSDECISDFGYKFEASKSYHFMVILESPSKNRQGITPMVRMFNATFTLKSNNGKLEATTPY